MVFIDTARFQHPFTETPETIDFHYQGMRMKHYKLPEAVDEVLKLSLPADLKKPLSPHGVRLFSKQTQGLFDIPAT
jgi:hypothetical protein